MIVSLEIFKKLTRLDDISDRNDLLEELLGAAEEHVVRATQRTQEELTEMNGGEFPRSLRQAIMMLAAYWFSQVEAGGAANVAEVPFGVTTLVKSWRKLADDPP